MNTLRTNNLNGTKAHRRISTMLCQALRHSPETLGIHLEKKGGWTNVETLIQKINEKYFFRIKSLEEAGEPIPKHLKQYRKFGIDEFYLQDLIDIYESDGKQRYTQENDFELIRCEQGHSGHLGIVIEYPEITLEHDVYHGTSPDFVDSILKEGINSQKRQYVHLSKDIETAITVGKRHSGDKEPVIFVIPKDTPIPFYITRNGVLHAHNVPPEFLTLLKEE
jgi:putative RNA 2'-phosphotransferase